MYFNPVKRLVLVVIAVCSPAAAAGAQELIDVVPPSGETRSLANAVSANGQVVVGWSGLIGDTVPATFSFGGGTNEFVTPSLLFPGFFSEATAVSDSGAVIVGQATFADGAAEAFRHTASGTERLGMLNGGNQSRAEDVTADGTLIVGSAHDGNTPAQKRAVTWSGGNGTIHALDSLGAGLDAAAFGVSGDGSVIVGYAADTLFIPHAAKWNPADGSVTDLGVLNAGALSDFYQSYAYAASDDGSVIVGSSQDGAASGVMHAFRWTSASGTMQSIDHNTYRSSAAYDVSGDGRVIVGEMSVGASSTGTRAFRYTDGDGMITVEDWLRNAGATINTDITSKAYGTNCDGSVVVGQTEDLHAFIARVPSSGACLAATNDGGDTGGDDGGSDTGGDTGGGDGTRGTDGGVAGIITVSDLNQSLSGAGAANSAVVNATGTDLNGAGSRPLDRRANINRNIAWATGDLGRDDHGQRNGTLGLGEAGFGHNFGPLQLNAALGATGLAQDTAYGGRTKTYGGFGKLEAIAPLANTRHGTLWGVLTGVAMFGKADVTRNYLDNAGQTDSSWGHTGLNSIGVRGRIEWEHAVPHLSPYGELAVTRACLDGYSESGGAFPASFNKLCNTATEARIGADATMPLTASLDFISTVEGVHRFEKKGSTISGQVTGLGGFNVGGAVYQQNWLRGAAGLAYHSGSSTFSLMGNATTKGETPSLWLSLSWQHRM